MSKQMDGSPVEQSTAESKVYVVNTAAITAGATPSSISLKAVREDTGADVTSTVFPSGSNTAAADSITLKPLTALPAAPVTYRIQVKFTHNGNIYEHFFRVVCAF